MNRYARPIARLAPGVAIEAAAAELQGLMRSVERDYPAFVQGRTAQVRLLQEVLFGRVRTPLLMLLAATACVLLLACANLAHLFMARLHARHREFGVRLAMGAGRWRLARLILIEASVFAAAGAAAALVLGQWTFDLIMARTPEFAHVYRLLPARVDWRVAGFAAALVAVALGIFGAIPAVRASRMDIRSSLQGGGAVTAARRGLRGDAGLIFVQSTVAIVLLVTGALIVRSFLNLAYQPLGFEPERVRAVTVQIPAGADGDSDAARAFQIRRDIHDRLRDRLQVPVTLAESMPGLTMSTGITRADATGEPQWVTAHGAGGGVFNVFGARLVRGRLFNDREAWSRAPVAVVDEMTATLLWPGEDAIGKAVRERDGTMLHVVGIVQTLRTNLRASDEQRGTAFIPLHARSRAPEFVYRTADKDVPVHTIRSIVQEVVPAATVVVRPFQPFEHMIGQPRFLAALLGALGFLVIALTVVGVFGVVNHEVARRTREVGIRMSLGADAGQVRVMVLRRAFVPAAFGVACGVAASLWWTRTLRTLLFGLGPNDPGTFVMSAALVLSVVIAATLLPARRASRVEPVVALRVE